MDICTVHATTLQDAWFQLVYGLMRGEKPHHVYEIDKGSYVGQKRLEYDYVLVQIDRPFERPLIPEIPPMLNIPAPVESQEYVDDYFAKYLMGTTLEPNETYIYGTWLAPGVERVIEQLKGAPGNNQAVVSIGGWAVDDYITGDEGKTVRIQHYGCVDTDNFIDPATQQRDPACLRMVDFRYDQDNTLHMIVYFRSWDLWNGFPANLAGLQLVNEYVAQAIGAKPGKMIASSKGLHIYDHAIDVAAQRLGMDNASTMEELLKVLENTKN